MQQMMHGIGGKKYNSWIQLFNYYFIHYYF